jgi:hypothetical protein
MKMLRGRVVGVWRPAFTTVQRSSFSEVSLLYVRASSRFRVVVVAVAVIVVIVVIERARLDVVCSPLQCNSSVTCLVPYRISGRRSPRGAQH